MRIPEVVAHRGYAAHYPENTLIALEAAVAAGCRYVEVDVQLSGDRVPVLFHDEGLARVCGVEGSVLDTPLSALKRLSVHEFERFGYRFVGNPIATLSELSDFLVRHPGVTAFVEIKEESLARFGIEEVLARVLPVLEPVARQCVLISFSLPLLAAARPRWHALGAVVERWRDARRARALRPEYLFCDIHGLPRLWPLRTRARIAVYEVPDAATALALARRGVNFVEGFAAGELLEGLVLAAADG